MSQETNGEHQALLVKLHAQNLWSHFVEDVRLFSIHIECKQNTKRRFLLDVPKFSPDIVELAPSVASSDSNSKDKNSSILYVHEEFSL